VFFTCTKQGGRGGKFPGGGKPVGPLLRHREHDGVVISTVYLE